MFLIRPANSRDTPAIIELNNLFLTEKYSLAYVKDLVENFNCWVCEKSEDNDNDEQNIEISHRKEQLPEILTSNQSEIEISALNHQFTNPENSQSNIVGYLLATNDQLISICVHSAFRRKGIGKNLLITALERSSSDLLMYVRTSNKPAYSLYLKYGTIVYIQPNYYEDGEAAFVIKLLKTSINDEKS